MGRVQVAKGGAAHEQMPMLVIVPRFFPPRGSFTMLGFGDIVLPGLLVVYMRVYDIAQQHTGMGQPGNGEEAGKIDRRSRGWGRGVYFIPASIGYGVGLMCTYGALILELGGKQVCG